MFFLPVFLLNQSIQYNARKEEEDEKETRINEKKKKKKRQIVIRREGGCEKENERLGGT